MGGKANLMQMLTKSNPEMASVLNILGNKTKKEEPNNNKDSQNFDMTNFVKCSDYFKK